MPRRRTTLGTGSLSQHVDVDRHGLEVLRRIVSRGLPFTEDAVMLAMWNTRRQRGSRCFAKVRQSSNTGALGKRRQEVTDYTYFTFSPDIDLLEVRQSGEVVGFELKGWGKAGRTTKPPMYYDGVDQALAYLVNPISSPVSQGFAGSIFDYVYLVHPPQTGVDRLTGVLERLTPLGLAVAGPGGVTELVKPRPNPYLNSAVKALFLQSLDALSAYTNPVVNPMANPCSGGSPWPPAGPGVQERPAEAPQGLPLGQGPGRLPAPASRSTRW